MSIPACTPAPRPDPVPRAASTAGASRPMDRTGGMLCAVRDYAESVEGLLSSTWQNEGYVS